MARVAATGGRRIPARRLKLPRDDLQSTVPDGGPLQVVLADGVLAALHAPSVDMAARSRFVLAGAQTISGVDSFPGSAPIGAGRTASQVITVN